MSRNETVAEAFFITTPTSPCCDAKITLNRRCVICSTNFDLFKVYDSVYMVPVDGQMTEDRWERTKAHNKIDLPNPNCPFCGYRGRYGCRCPYQRIPVFDRNGDIVYACKGTDREYNFDDYRQITRYSILYVNEDQYNDKMDDLGANCIIPATSEPQIEVLSEKSDTDSLTESDTETPFRKPDDLNQDEEIQRVLQMIIEPAPDDFIVKTEVYDAIIKLISENITRNRVYRLVEQTFDVEIENRRLLDGRKRGYVGIRLKDG